MDKVTGLLAALLLPLSLSPVLAGKAGLAPPALSPAAFSDGITRALAENRIPGVSIAQISRGRVVRVAAYGLQSPGKPATPATLYNMPR